jgi:acyl-CoA synthetase (NDP forming)
VAVARYDGEPGSDEAEVAFVVRDDHQGRGLSTILFEHLAAYARTKGIVRFIAEVLPDNRKMLAVFQRVGFDVRQEFDSGIVDVVLDLDPTPGTVERIAERELRGDARAVARFVTARSVAVLGASRTSAEHIGTRLLRSLLDGGFLGVVHVVHPQADAVGGIAAQRSLVDIEGGVDLAVVAVPAEALDAAMADCVAARVRSVLIVTAGYSDPDGLARKARRNGIRTIGPESLGVLVPSSHLHASWVQGLPEDGAITVSSQSGPLGGIVLDRMAQQGLGLRVFASLGERADISGNDVLAWAESDAETHVVLMHTVTFGNPRKFARLARRVAQRVPIVAVKARDPDDLLVDALYDQAGVIRVGDVGEQLDLARLLTTSPLPAGDRVAILATASGPAALAAGDVRGAGLQLAELSGSTSDAVRAAVPFAISSTNPVDLSFRATPADLAAVLEVLAVDGGIDAVLVVDAPAAAISPSEPRADELVDVIAAHRGERPVALVGYGRQDAIARGVPVFAETAGALTALGHAARRRAWLDRPRGATVELTDAEAAAAEAITQRGLRAHPSGTLLTLADAHELLGVAGIAVASGAAVTDRDRAVEQAAFLQFPLVLKSARRTGRSTSGGVALDLTDVRAVGMAWDRMTTAIGAAAMVEAVVQEMAPAGVETRVALVPHPDFGSVITFGFGGLYGVEIADVSAAAVPITDTEARRLVERSKAARAIARLDGDVSAVADLVARLSALVDAVPTIDRVTLDPVIVSPSGAVVVDAEIHVAPAPERSDVPIRRV